MPGPVSDSYDGSLDPFIQIEDARDFAEQHDAVAVVVWLQFEDSDDPSQQVVTWGWGTTPASRLKIKAAEIGDVLKAHVGSGDPELRRDFRLGDPVVPSTERDLT